jgi:hypothetical protein
MNSKEFSEQFTLLSDRGKTLFMCRLAHAITVHARSTYVAGSEEVSDPRLLRWLNEIQHLLIGQTANAIARRAERYSDTTFCEILFAISEESPYGAPFSRMLSRALDEAIQENTPEGNK